MVCMGNICRSPLAEGLLERKIKEQNLNFEVDSAGTTNFHTGEAPDKRMIVAAAKFGTDISTLKARQITKSDLSTFDLIFVMDRDNYWYVMDLCEDPSQKEKVIPILDLIYPEEQRSVPDPYYGGEQGFIDVYHLLDLATDKIIELYKENNAK